MVQQSKATDVVTIKSRNFVQQSRDPSLIFGPGTGTRIGVKKKERVFNVIIHKSQPSTRSRNGYRGNSEGT